MVPSLLTGIQGQEKRQRASTEMQEASEDDNSFTARVVKHWKRLPREV